MAAGEVLPAAGSIAAGSTVSRRPCDCDMTSHPKFTLLLGLILLTSLGAVYLQFSTEVRSELAQLVRRGEHQRQLLRESKNAALRTVEGLRAAAENYLTLSGSVALRYSHLLGEVSDKNGYGLTGLTPPSEPESSLNLTGLGSFVGDAALRAELDAALLLDPMFRWVKSVYPQTPWVYYLSRRRFMCVYPYIPFDDFFMDDAFYDLDLFSRGTPEKNPLRNAYITEVYLDEAGKGLMVSVGAPVYQQGDFKGIVGFDLTLKALGASLQEDRYPGDELFLVNDKRDVIAMAADSHPLEDSSEKLSLSDLRPGLFELALAHVDDPVPVPFERSKVVAFDSIAGNWMLIVERPTWRVYRAAALATLPLIAFLVIIFGMLALYLKRKEREEQIASERSVRRFRNLLDVSTDMIAVIDASSGRFLDVNRTLCEFSGFDRRELLARHAYDLSTEFNSAEKWRDAVQALREQGRVFLEDRCRRADGSSSIVELSVHHAREGDREYIVVILRDIADRKRAEEALRKANLRFTSLLDGIDARVYVADMSSHELLYVNPTIEATLGDIAGRRCWEYIYPGQKGPCDFCTNDKLLDGRGEPTGAFAWEYQDPRRDAFFSCADRAIPWDDGRYVRLSLAYDITERKREEMERKRLERRLQQTQKLEAIGQLTGGIAHDFNNILVSVTGFAELARTEAGGNVKLKEYLDQISKAGQRARNLIRQLLVYSRGDTDATAAVVDLVPQLEEVLSMLRPMLSTRVEIKTDWPASSPMVRVDPVHLQQLLMNLSINARDAMAPGGPLTISVRRQSFHGEECQICHDRVQGEWVCIGVQDSGTGISPHLLDKIFQPFFTTKEIGSGGGMGLAVVQGIVSTYRGHILVESRVGQGTRFDILLPLASDSANPISSAREALVERDLRGRRILVVDDEAVVRLFLSRVLTAAKADIVLCASGAEALEAFRSARDEFSLLLTDQAMPGMSGVDLVREIRKLDSGLPVLIFSGYLGAVGEREVSDLGISGVLMKPLTPDELVAAISRALAPR